VPIKKTNASEPLMKARLTLQIYRIIKSRGQDVEITVRPTRKEHGQVSIVFP